MSLTFNNFNVFLVGINMFKVNKKNSGTRREICSKLPIKTPEPRQFTTSIFTPGCRFFKVEKLTLKKKMLVGLITGWQLATLKLALLIKHFLGFLTRLMVLKLHNKSQKCLLLNFLVLLCPPHMIPLPFNTPSFTIHVILQCFTHCNCPQTFGIELIPVTSSTIRYHSPGCISQLEACESTKPTGVYTALSVNLR